jgi:hypothetical protein
MLVGAASVYVHDLGFVPRLQPATSSFKLHEEFAGHRAVKNSQMRGVLIPGIPAGIWGR